MSDISALESRITAALDRIRAGVDGMAAAAPVDVGAALQDQLDEERMANAQLQERVRVVKDRQDAVIAELEGKISGHQTQMAALDAEMQKLRQSNADLRELNAQLRAAVAEDTSAPELVNRAMMAEIDALQAQRSSEAAEVDAILSELKPMIEEA
jgi:predicted RNase H-like nuclease (RuvC/YqgF family)